MSSEDGNRDTLYIPAGLKTQKEIYTGFGKNELRQAIIGTLIIGGLDALFTLLVFNNMPLFVILLLLGIFVSVMCVQKDVTNLSVLDMVKNLYNYIRSQKKFYYKSLDEWRWDNK
ncbi:hypothetical protein [Ruminiclostridium cellulolyticum]|uniref:PrgI family protein n=1 Tax=Ruminiclostridium cellulolyticum (strain ATCC 35319 / DSM 5812 / JCM 6584 / H10) TaxID=394503 RepID=B8I0A8_RUMCH|nr:hypothetical protein [Ruminiclostridium cellulolyticum]ACL77434.1 conserved hypothetical protein [Ruminiclostridium cellulolyticum H10]